MKDINQTNFPPIADQYRASAMYAREAFPDREIRKDITFFGQADFVEEHLSADEYDVDYTGFPTNFVLIIAAIRYSADLMDYDVPEDVSLGMSIINQVKENMDEVGKKWRVPDDRFEELLDLHCRDALFSDTELGEDEVEQVLDVDTSCDAPECAN